MSENVELFNVTRELPKDFYNQSKTFPIDSFSKVITGILDVELSDSDKIVTVEDHLRDENKYSREAIELVSQIAIINGDNKRQAEVIATIAQKYQNLLNRLDKAIEIPDLNSELPNEAPMLYKDWKADPENKGKTAIDCLNELYGEYIQKGKEVLYQDNLNYLDIRLLEAVKNHCKTRKLTTKNFILPKTARRKKEAKLTNPKNIKKIRNLDRQHRIT